MDWKPNTYPLYDGGVKQPCISKTVAVGNIIFLSSFDGRDLKTGKVASKKFEEQMVVCLDNIKSALEEAASSLGNLVKNTIFLKNIADCPSMWKTMLEYFKKKAPQLVEQPPVVTVC